jgi:hypothetical protein
MDYGKVLSRAWQITWRWKILWILGFLSAMGQGWNWGGNPSYSTDASDWGYRFQGYVPPRVWAVIAGVACLVLLIGIALWVVSIIARGGLIAGVQQVEDEGSTGFRQAWRVGVKRFWTLFGISILTAIPIFILVVAGIAALVAVFVGSGFAIDARNNAIGGLGIATGILCGGLFCCGMIVVGIVLSQIQIYADRAAVLEGLGWIDAFKRGWQVIRENLGPTIIFWLIFLVIGLIIAAVIFGGVLVVTVPFIGVATNIQPDWWLTVPICFGGLLALIVGGLISAIVQTFTSSTWTLVYRELTGLAAGPEVEPVAEA